MWILGYLFICVINLLFSGLCIVWFLIGGFELGNVLTSKEPIQIIIFICLCALNAYIWKLLISISPFTVVGC